MRPRIGLAGGRVPLIVDDAVIEPGERLVHGAEQRPRQCPGRNADASAHGTHRHLVGEPDLFVPEATAFVRRLETCPGDTRYLTLPEEGEDPGHGLFRCGDQVFVPDPVAPAGMSFLKRHDPLDGGQPVASYRGDAVAWVLSHEGIEAVPSDAPGAGLDPRGDDVQAVPVKADELRLRIQLDHQVRELVGVERLVTPATLLVLAEV